MLTPVVLQVIRDILLIGHRQAFAWVDEWCGESEGAHGGEGAHSARGGRGCRADF